MKKRNAIMHKQAILIRADLKLPKGKAAGQAAHASVEAALKAGKEDLSAWRQDGQMKIVLKVADEKELIKHFQQAKDDGLSCSLVTDAGKTVIAPGTRTAAAIGPAEAGRVDRIIRDLKLL